MVKYQICVDPRTKTKCEIEEIIQYIHHCREVSEFFPKDLEAINLTPWKARQINRFVYPVTGKRVKFFKDSKENEKYYCWGKNTRIESYLPNFDDFISVEDGFIRSVGLGADLYPPLSLLFDKKAYIMMLVR